MTNGANNNPDDAHEVALELVKQLITLASGVIALSATFIEKIKPLRQLLFVVLAASWVALLVSVLFGLETISAIVKSRLESNSSWSQGYGRKAAKISKYAFVGGIFLFALFAFLSLLLRQSDVQSLPSWAYDYFH
jgi:hypothetical protein